MREKLTSLLVLEGFSPLDSNVSSFRVFLKREFSHVNIIYTIDFTSDTAFGTQEYDTIRQSALKLLEKHGLRQEPHILTICLTTDVGRATEICAHDSRAWIIDKENADLTIPLNHLEDFYGMKNKLTEFLKDPENAVIQMRHLEELVRKEVERRVKPKAKFIPYITIGVAAINILVFFINLFMNNSLCDFGSLDTRVLTQHQWYRILTCAFLHADWYHLVNNMFIFCVSGTFLERILGHSQFIMFYFISILASGLSSLLYHASLADGISAIGASGGAYGLLGGMIVILLMHPKNYNGEMLIRLFLMIFCVITGISEGFRTPYVDNAAHLGGFSFGIIVMILFILYKRSRRKGKQNEN